MKCRSDISDIDSEIEVDQINASRGLDSLRSGHPMNKTAFVDRLLSWACDPGAVTIVAMVYYDKLIILSERWLSHA
jgi:hypothetical protein